MDERISKLIETYTSEILKINSNINLTRINDESGARTLHIEDSLSALPELEASPEGRYGDVGSGGGFPGVPLGIASGRRTILIDSVKKKMAAVESILESMGLSDHITTYGGRIEEMAEACPESFSVLTARALSKMPSLLELAAPLLEKGGRLICLKSHPSDEEKDGAASLKEKLGMRLIGTREFMLSDGMSHRSIFVFEKFKEPDISLPRRNGMAQKKPLA